MRHVVWLAAVWLMVAGIVQADEGEAAAQAILDRAAKAMGGAKALAGFPGVTLKAKGTLEAKGMKLDVGNGEWSGRGLDTGRFEAEVTFMGRLVPVGFLVSKGDVWSLSGGSRGNKVPADLTGVFQANLRCLRLAENPTLLQDKAFKRSPLGELKINDRETVGLKVTRPGQPDVDLFFDKKTGLLYKTELRIKEGKDGQEASHAFLFDDYKDAGGVKHFTKLTFQRDGMKVLELECSDIKLQEKLDDSVFAPPAKNKP
jgi:hypothetical protein